VVPSSKMASGGGGGSSTQPPDGDGKPAVAIAESASAANKTARVAQFEKAGEAVAKLTPYGRSGGGHHIDMKSAFKSHPLYDYRTALCLSNEEMTRLGIIHELANKTQRQMCETLIKEGKPITRRALMNISVEALVAGGADRQLARDIVARSWWDLKGKGVRMPTDMPWGRKK
jgi:hypothetical protein